MLFRTTEGRILLLGITVAALGLITMGVVAFWSPQAARMIGAMSFFNVIFGRAVSMSIGYAGGYGHILVVPVNIWVETVLVLLFYPVFVFSMRKLVVFPSLKRFLERTRTSAERHHDKVRRYGIAGLFIFVWFPFWMTGPVVGSAIGFLLGFPAWLTVLVVLAGTYIAMVVWAFVMFDLHSRAAVFAPWAPSLIVVLLILFVLAGYWLNRQAKGREKSNLKKCQHDNDELGHDQTTPPDTNKHQH
ncbi:MAG: small multi-drug export protein [Gammaproteobacteria bacterium]|nr:small multi-drug export protein [Gammaproteobacteria bacterium]NNJ97604.1 small multi-drug export protein [Gammaproteobacteria bacterium]